MTSENKSDGQQSKTDSSERVLEILQRTAFKVLARPSEPARFLDPETRAQDLCAQLAEEVLELREVNKDFELLRSQTAQSRQRLLSRLERELEDTQEELEAAEGENRRLQAALAAESKAHTDTREVLSSTKSEADSLRDFSNGQIRKRVTAELAARELLAVLDKFFISKVFRKKCDALRRACVGGPMIAPTSTRELQQPTAFETSHAEDTLGL